MNKPSNEHEAMTEESLALQRMNTAEDFPRNTCPASRITAGLADWRGCRMRFGIIEWLWISLWITRLDRWPGTG